MVEAVTPLIELKAIRKQYGGLDGAPVVEVLHGIDLRIHAGEFVAIVGQSGSGKSTLMHILGCLDSPSSGDYFFQGKDVARLDADSLARLRREAFGFVFQGYHLIPTESARENVEVPAVYAGTPIEQRNARASALLERLGLAERQANRPHQLSGGQQQRVSIARALMNGGHIILADEPTGALDSQSGKEVMALFHELADAGHTIILITHDRSVAAQARRVIEIRDGQIVGDSGKAEQTQAPMPDALANFWEPTAQPTERAVQGEELREALRAAWRTMRVNRARTLLTLLGIIIGVASVIVMMAVGEGARQRVMAQMGTMGTTIMYMSGTKPVTGGPRGILSDEDLAAVRTLPEISRVMPVIGDPITVRFANVSLQVYVFAANEEMPSMHHWRVAEGRYYTAQEDKSLAPVVVLGAAMRKRFFGDKSPVGELLLIGNSPFEVIGVMEERGADSGAQSYDDMVFIPYQAGRARVYQAQTQPDYVVMEAASSDVVFEAERSVRDLLMARHGDREDFSIGNAAARLQAEASTRRSMTIMLGLIAAVSLLVGGIGVMNVMLMSVKERTREIGIRMATGARQRDILRQFLTESMVLTVSGGMTGIALAALLGIGLALVGMDMVFSVSAIVGAFGCAVITGLVFGFMPARTAARMDPVVALAGE
ncbi:ATP-binding cassette domain-containing protein [Alcaligenaceae bacterium 429]|uniref:ABC transporter permease n=1 Tax=Paenalcaligenes sp. Me52 TaxID=3392038 RepID=UPI001092DBDD|nr:ATP-binding cassette domain-containing protein [Alcaligenaceae bacterium 429]